VYGALVVPPQDNAGTTGYIKTYVDGVATGQKTWQSGGPYDDLGKTPFGIIIGGAPWGNYGFYTDYIHVYVKDASRVMTR
jgi:hypothetical protein